jgi:anaerobic magnesium-protoporphyrin IX monomethyl ester cyclase
MKISLLSPYPDITNFGLRTIASLLLQAGHQVQFICLPDFCGDGESHHVTMSRDRYPREVVEQLLTIVAGSDLVGITLMTHYFDSARQLTEALKRELGVPVVWGGFHPSVRPEECAQHADYVCVGEGEDFMLRLVLALETGRGLESVPGLARWDGTHLVTTPPGLLEQDLDRFPAPDWSLDDQWILFEGRIWRVTPELLHRYLRNGTVSRQFGRVGYQTMTGRGCPHCCAYCGNSFTRDLYKGQRYVRFRSVEHVMAELEAALVAQPFVDMMWFSDDSFFGRTEADLRNFADAYKRRIGLPFYLLGSPGTITEEKVAILVDAGLHCVQVGIEHGSPRIQELFQRSGMGNERILETARILARYTDRTAPPQYDVIYDVDWESLDDQLETLRLIARLPKPYRLQIFTLVYYPGTVLYTLAKKDGFIHDERAEIYDRMFFERHDSYANTLLFLARTGHFPQSLLKVLSEEKVATILTSEPLAPIGRLAKAGAVFYRRVKHNPALVRARALGSTGKSYLPPETTGDASP